MTALTKNVSGNLFAIVYVHDNYPVVEDWEDAGILY